MQGRRARDVSRDMTRKKGKRTKRERIPGAGDGSPGSAGQFEEGTETVSPETSTSVETFTSEPAAVEPAPEAGLPSPVAFRVEHEEAKVMQEEPGQEKAGRYREPEPAQLSQPAPAKGGGGLFARLSRWFLGPSQPLEVPSEAAATPPAPAASFEPSPPASAAVPQPPVALPPQREPLAPPAEAKWASPRQRPETTGAARVDHLLAVLTLERVLPELDAARREMEEMKIGSNHRIRQLEAERDQVRAEAEKTRAEKSGSDSRTGALRTALDDLERQARETQDTAAERIRQLEAERDQRRSEAEASRAEQHDLRLHIRQLEAQLEINQAARPVEEWAALESRIQTLEEDLAAAQHRGRQQREAVEVELDAARERVQQENESLEARLRQSETERKDLAASLAAKEEALRGSSRPAEIAPSRVQELEAELAEWKARAEAAPSRQEPLPASQEAAPAPVAADEGRLADLYQQSMSRLTVILACADLLAMNPRMDASSRETAQAIRDQGKLLADIIKTFTLPPDTRKAE